MLIITNIARPTHDQKKLDTPNAHMYNRSLSWFGKNGTSIKSGGV
jgi:hypothetical protein